MFKNYPVIQGFKTAWRNIKKNKGFFALNFIGLYISVVVCILIGLIILHETNFDKQTNSKISIYRIVSTSVSSNGKTYSPVTPYPLASAMRAAMPAEKLVSQIHFQTNALISFDDKKFKINNIN